MNEDWLHMKNADAPVLARDFVKRLSALAGEWNGQPKLRLVWGQSSTIFWQGRQRMKYLAASDVRWRGWKVTQFNKDGTVKGVKFINSPQQNPPRQADGLIIEPQFDHYDVGIPRWFVEQLFHPDIACQDWDKDRYEFNKETGEIEDWLGPAPNRGYYGEAFYMIADHSKCEQVVFGGSPRCKPGCIGEYREPDGRDLAYIEWLLAQFSKEDCAWDWNVVPPPEVVANALAARRQESERQRLEGIIKTEEMLHKEIVSARKRKGSVQVSAVKEDHV